MKRPIVKHQVESWKREWGKRSQRGQRYHKNPAHRINKSVLISTQTKVTTRESVWV